MIKKIIELLKIVLPYFAMIEGIDHFVISTIAVIGLWYNHDLTFFSLFTPVIDYIFGIGTFATGFIFRNKKKKK